MKHPHDAAPDPNATGHPSGHGHPHTAANDPSPWLDRAATCDREDIANLEEEFAQHPHSQTDTDEFSKTLEEHHHIPMGNLKENLQALAPGSGNDKPDHFDLSMELVQTVGADNLIYAENTLHLWDNSGIWRQLDDREVKGAVQSQVKERGVAVTSSLVNSVVELLKNAQHRAESPFGGNTELKINCANGTLVWQNGTWTLEDFNRDDHFTSFIPVAYDPAATCPNFEHFLGTCFQGDADLDQKVVAVLQMLGYTLLRSCTFEKAILLVGSGANGKSVLLGLVEMLVGKHNVSGVQPLNFDNRFQVAHLRGKLANIVTELPENCTVPDGVMKQLISGELITAERKNQAPFNFRPCATLWIGTNHLPRTSDFSDALFRRMLIIRFNQQFHEGDPRRDPNLKTKLALELPGILNLALAALGQLLTTERFEMPASAIQAAQDWRHEVDPVSHFINASCTKSAQAKTEFGALELAFRRFLRAESEADPWPPNVFSRRSLAWGFVASRHRGASAWCSAWR